MTEIEKQKLTSMDITEYQKQKLKELFPEAFTEDDKIDWDKLRLTLGDTVDIGKERFGMNWPGKSECFKTIQQPSIGTLIPEREQSLNFESTQNVFVEGDNLEVLKLLQKSYLGKIKMIFIDPPYNTGNEFIYPDNFNETLETYLEYTGQVDSEGKKFSTNTETDGRFHSKWMNMIYTRLFLAKNLLSEDGVIFISIDDREQDNLKKICNEIFGEENFIANLVWEKRYTRSNDAKLMASVIDYILFYRKSGKVSKLREPRNEKSDSIYSNPDNDPRGSWTSVSYVSQRTKDQRPNLSYKIRNPSTGKNVEHPTNAWKYSQDQNSIHENESKLFWGTDGGYQFPRLKKFLSELTDGLVPINLWNYKDTGTVDDGTKEVDNLLGKDIFDYPKPTRLIKRMLNLIGDKNALVLDFFAGSGTTAQAVLDLNSQDDGNRKFILIQLPERIEKNSLAAKAGYKKISNLTVDRIKKSIDKIKNQKEQEAKKEKETLFGETIKANIDLGFKVFRLAPSNFRIWDNAISKEPDAIQQALFEHVDHISPEAKQEAILYELLLKSGFKLTTAIQQVTLEGKLVYSVADGELLICLEKELSQEVIKAIAERKPSRVICLDGSFQNNDQLKTNAVQIMKSKGVLNFRTV